MGSERPWFCAVISDPDSLHFMAPVGSQSPVLDRLHLLANTGTEEPAEECVGDFVGHSWACCTSRLLMSHWPTLTAREAGKYQTKHNIVLSPSSVPSTVSAVEWVLSKHH